MNTVNRNMAFYLLTGLNLSFQKMPRRDPDVQSAQEVLDEALSIFNSSKKHSPRALDYALAHLYGRFVRLIGLQGFKLDPEALMWWHKLKDFMENDIHEELSSISQPRGIL
ncbi:hypothetical protein LACPH_002706 [Lacticaseibacillus parahuelsenbergensis]|uniref:Uncharacterized protein n=1 Tax=Lacticaseibacillus parahuelsenbergensis TaxID=3068305 RepID=A0ABY9L2E7_9LACO|nr:MULTISPECIES: hypothetical protein [Lacticaseibacillus]MDE3283795.1 hypothetical protein [Lacticaseibacillus casei]WLV77923.1 hypothetical protein LACPH_002706 [Lacticaseibacillus sp. NCIMB 15471]